MASVKRWAIGSLLACLALALAYLPPRGATSSGRRTVFSPQSPQGTPARRRTQALAEEWRAADGALHLMNARRHLQELVRQTAPYRGSLVVVTEPAGVPAGPAHVIDSALHTAWRQLGLDETKVKVAVIVQLIGATQARDRPLPEQTHGTYLAPDSTDRTTCMAVVPVGRYWTRAFSGDPRWRGGRIPFDALVQLLKAGLGPCAFYAAYGTPGKPVRQWLVARGWDLAWNLDPGARGRQRSSFIGLADPRYSWYWDAIYSLPAPAVACLAGRPEGCRAAVLDGAGEQVTIPFPDIMRIDRRWGRTQRLVEGQYFLADVAHEVGRDRFLSFWTSPMRVDTALAAALKQPVGEWTAAWQRDFVRPIRLGPTPPSGSVAIAMVLAVLAVSIVTLTASRRQVR
jgi:hypothetical protein